MRVPIGRSFRKGHNLISINVSKKFAFSTFRVETSPTTWLHLSKDGNINIMNWFDSLPEIEDFDTITKG
jgi:hypothetical protein